MKITVDDLMEASGRGLRYNEGKLRYDLIPAKANEEYAKVLTKGLEKYPPNNRIVTGKQIGRAHV